MLIDQLKDKIREDLTVIATDKTLVKNMIRNSQRTSRPVVCLHEARSLLEVLKIPVKIQKSLSRLIRRTQSFIDKPNVQVHEDENIFNNARVQVAEIVENAELTTSIQTSFKMSFSERYGHHLVAAQDFEPGEILCVEKPYHHQVLDSKTPSYCCKCSKFLWTIIACDHCSWHVYCSESCRAEAWNECHSLECSPLQSMKKTLPLQEFVDLTSSSIFFKALKENGSLNKLEAQVKDLDQRKDCRNQDLIISETFSSFATLYLTPTRQFTKMELNSCVRCGSLYLIGLAKSILNTSYDIFDIKQLMMDDTAIFIGALLCKLELINKGKIMQVQQYDPSPAMSATVPTNISTLLTALLTSISCMPNVRFCSTSQNKFVMYALQPIKTGDQLFSSIHLSSIYDNSTKAQRNHIIRSFYRDSCDCEACMEDWTEKLSQSNEVRFT
ncbi:hypothetical protein QAD02_005436 [Eretmocerus hayati]|uniref:Uncharacterized protein n=2 Tax=Eretmocerus hayati TaxID=131215 RepID=A0ACC2NSV3_9HYME|nr:hypothetical protein QAD02_004790 [Eretmocerus hayati]KAJ8674174.1 hypothetical protein QAD02_005436 [Eretmocerus hayati]